VLHEHTFVRREEAMRRPPVAWRMVGSVLGSHVQTSSSTSNGSTGTLSGVDEASGEPDRFGSWQAAAASEDV